MKKAIRIKTAVFMIAWCMIFAHGIIPHNHIDTDQAAHAGLIHDHHNSGHNAEFRSLCSDFEACLVSNILLQKLSTDENLILPESRSCTYLVITTFSHTVISDQKTPSGFIAGSALLRAPPAA